jgi:hypothetical protein
MKIGGMGEQAIRVQFYELRRIDDLPEEVQIVGILPELPDSPEVAYVDCGAGRGHRPVLVYDSMRSPPLPADWIPHRRPKSIENRCLYVHVQHRYCFRGAEDGAPLTIEDLEDFLKRFKLIALDEESKRGQKVPEEFAGNFGAWVNDDAL